jgi:hypothetical protein
MKKLTYFILATIFLSIGLAQLTNAGYTPPYISPSAAGLTVGSSTIAGGSSGQCLTISTGVLGSASCASGANTALSNLASVAINDHLTPGSDNAIAVGSSSKRVADFWGYEFDVKSNAGSSTAIRSSESGSSYAFILPINEGTSGQVLTTTVTSQVSTTSWTTPTGYVLTYSSGGTLQTSTHIIQDTCTLGTSCSITLTGSAVFSSSTSYTCVAQDDTGIFATKCAQSSGSALVITGNGTDVIRYILIGN